MSPGRWWRIAYGLNGHRGATSGTLLGARALEGPGGVRERAFAVSPAAAAAPRSAPPQQLRPPSRCGRAAIADSQAAKPAIADVEHRNGTIGNCHLPDW
jgi:hypothetical protein